MASRLRPLRVLIPVGVLSGCAVAAFRATGPSEDNPAEEGAPEPEPLSTRLATQLEGDVCLLSFEVAVAHSSQAFHTKKGQTARARFRSEQGSLFSCFR